MASLALKPYPSSGSAPPRSSTQAKTTIPPTRIRGQSTRRSQVKASATVIQLVTLVVLIGITRTVLSGGGGYASPGGRAVLLGFLVLAAFLAGELAASAELPRITGFLLLGILVGPYALGVLPSQAVVDFRLINGGALSLIALTAGGELRVAGIRRRLASIVSILAFQLVIVFLAVVVAVYLGRGFVPFLANAPPRAAVAAGLIFGLVAVAKSPATTVAVITEERARGQLTETVLGITVLKDVVVLVLIALVLPLAAEVAEPSAGFSFSTFGEVLLSVVASVVVGFGVGWLLVQYLRKADEYRILVLLMTSFFLVSLGERFGMEYILIAMAAGFYVQNFSRQGPPFLRALEANALPIYALFFAVAGADLRVDVLRNVWAFATLLIVIRILTLIGSTYLGARVAGDPLVMRRYSWMGFLAQAGVTLGIANIVRERFDVWGPDVATVIVAMIAVNQLIGPPAFRYALIRAGETWRSR